MPPEEPQAPEAPDHVVGVDGQEIRIGDRIAYAVTHHQRGQLRIGTVKRIYVGRYSALTVEIAPDHPKSGWSPKIINSFIRASSERYIKL